MPHTERLSLSVFRLQRLGHQGIRLCGDSVARQSGRSCYGHAEVVAQCFLDSSLQIEADDTPPGHANVVGWPNAKHEQKLVAIKLAEQARLQLW